MLAGANECQAPPLCPPHTPRSLEGAAPLAPSFDTAGWLARDAELLAAVGASLLRGGTARTPRDSWSLLVPEVRKGGASP